MKNAWKSTRRCASKTCIDCSDSIDCSDWKYLTKLYGTWYLTENLVRYFLWDNISRQIWWDISTPFHLCSHFLGTRWGHFLWGEYCSWWPNCWLGPLYRWCLPYLRSTTMPVFLHRLKHNSICTLESTQHCCFVIWEKKPEISHTLILWDI